MLYDDRRRLWRKVLGYRVQRDNAADDLTDPRKMQANLAPLDYAAFNVLNSCKREALVGLWRPPSAPPGPCGHASARQQTSQHGEIQLAPNVFAPELLICT